MTFDDPLHAGQADAGAGELGVDVQPLERLEQPGRIGGIEAGPVVPHETAGGGAVRGHGAEFDGGIVPPGRELPGVPDQVLYHRADETAIRGHQDTVLDGDAHLPAGFSGPQVADDVGHLRAEINEPEVYLAARDPSQLQQVVDEHGHPLARGPDAPGVFAAGFAELIAVLLQQRFAVPAQRPQWGAQVMGDRVAERLQVLVRQGQVSRALFHAGFQVGVESPDLGFGVALRGEVTDGPDE